MRAAMKVIEEHTAGHSDPVLRDAVKFARQVVVNSGRYTVRVHRNRDVEAACQHRALARSQCCLYCGIRLVEEVQP